MTDADGESMSDTSTAWIMGPAIVVMGYVALCVASKIIDYFPDED